MEREVYVRTFDSLKSVPCASEDADTARAFADSWNNLPQGSVYTKDQFLDWIDPIKPEDIEGRTVLELGCGNGSLMVHMAGMNPSYLEGVDLGDSVISAQGNMAMTAMKNWKITKADLTTFRSEGFDLVYCIGVLHHLKDPGKGFEAVVANTKKGGRFHCWVYAKEGNSIIIHFVDPIRRITSRLPWWLVKYVFATLFVVPYYLYAKAVTRMKRLTFTRHLPLYEYSLWIAQREFAFFRHVAFDQLVTPRTAYISRSMIEELLKTNSAVDQSSTYIIMRNGNSWKFGGIVK